MSPRRLLLIGLTLVGVAGLTLVVNRLNPNRPDDSVGRAVAALEQVGAKVDREGKSLTGPVEKVRLGGKAVTDADLTSLAVLTDLEEVRLQGTSVTDEGLKHLRPLGKLRVLDLRGTPVTDAGLAELRNHPGLEELILLQTNVTDAGLKELIGLRRLWRLEVSPGCLTPRGFRAFCDLGLVETFPGVQDRGGFRPARPENVEVLQFPPLPLAPEGIAGWLAEVPALRTLQVEARYVTDDLFRALGRRGKLHLLDSMPPGPSVGGMLSLEALARLEAARVSRDEDITQLWVGDCPITDASLELLPPLQKLRSLIMVGTGITDDGLGHVGRLTELDELYLYRTRVSDRGLRHLAGLSKLESLGLASTAVTDAGLKELQALKGLRKLSLVSTGVTDAGLDDLGRLTGLRELDLSGTRTTEAGLERLRAALPDCRIDSSFPRRPR